MEKILIVEDEESVRENLVQLLSCEGYQCQSADNGLTALNYLEKNKPDLIISDITMPYVDGYQLFEKVNGKIGKAVPFIFLTAKIDRDSRRLGMGMGADDFITKPYTIKEILTAVNTRISQKQQIENSFENLRTNIALYVPHELRTPLVSILGYSDILLDDIESMSHNEVIEMVTDIKKSGMRLHERIEKFVQYTQLTTEENDKDKFGMDLPKFFNPSNLICINELNECYDCIPREDDIKIQFEDTILQISEEHLKVIIKELITNACKFSPNGSEILLTGRNSNMQYEILIKDKGIGIPLHSIEEIKAFEQFDRKKYQQIGNGLGLSIVKLICYRYKIKFEVSSKPNEGTKIKLIFNLSNS